MEKDFLIPQKEMEKIVKLTDDASSISIVVLKYCQTELEHTVETDAVIPVIDHLVNKLGQLYHIIFNLYKDIKTEETWLYFIKGLK